MYHLSQSNRTARPRWTTRIAALFRDPWNTPSFWRGDLTLKLWTTRDVSGFFFAAAFFACACTLFATQAEYSAASISVSLTLFLALSAIFSPTYRSRPVAAGVVGLGDIALIPAPHSRRHGLDEGAQVICKLRRPTDGLVSLALSNGSAISKRPDELVEVMVPHPHWALRRRPMRRLPNPPPAPSDMTLDTLALLWWESDENRCDVTAESFGEAATHAGLVEPSNLIDEAVQLCLLTRPETGDRQHGEALKLTPAGSLLTIDHLRKEDQTIDYVLLDPTRAEAGQGRPLVDETKELVAAVLDGLRDEWKASRDGFKSFLSTWGEAGDHLRARQRDAAAIWFPAALFAAVAAELLTLRLVGGWSFGQVFEFLAAEAPGARDIARLGVRLEKSLIVFMVWSGVFGIMISSVTAIKQLIVFVKLRVPTRVSFFITLAVVVLPAIYDYVAALVDASAILVRGSIRADYLVAADHLRPIYQYLPALGAAMAAAYGIFFRLTLILRGSEIRIDPDDPFLR